MDVIPHPSSDVIDGIFYRCSDGKPMAETFVHIKAIYFLLDALEDYFADRPDIYIVGNVFWYWEQGKPSACAAPDVMVIPGVGRRRRRSFKSWEDGGGNIPAVIFEMASENTWRENLNEKRETYERLGVKEYFVFDPEEEFLKPPLVGFRLENGQYQSIAADEDRGMLSQELGVRVVPEGVMLRVSDGRTGVRILTRQEHILQERELTEEAQQALAGKEKELAKKEKEVAGERKRADSLAAEVARLQKLLQSSNPGDSSPATG